MSDEEGLNTAIESLEALATQYSDEDAEAEQAVETMVEVLRVLERTESEEREGGLVEDIADLYFEYDIHMSGQLDTPAAEQAHADRHERD